MLGRRLAKGTLRQSAARALLALSKLILQKYIIHIPQISHISPPIPAQVALLSGLSKEDVQAALKGANERGGEHLSRLLKFVVARAGGCCIFLHFLPVIAICTRNSVTCPACSSLCGARRWVLHYFSKATPAYFTFVTRNLATCPACSSLSWRAPVGISPPSLVYCASFVFFRSVPHHNHPAGRVGRPRPAFLF